MGSIVGCHQNCNHDLWSLRKSELGLNTLNCVVKRTSRWSCLHENEQGWKQTPTCGCSLHIHHGIGTTWYLMQVALLDVEFRFNTYSGRSGGTVKYFALVLRTTGFEQQACASK